MGIMNNDIETAKSLLAHRTGTLSWSRNRFAYIYATCICMHALMIADISWLWMLPKESFTLFMGILALFKIVCSKSIITNKKAMLMGIYSLYAFFNMFVWQSGFMGILYGFTNCMIVFSIILSTVEEQRLILKIMTNFFVMIILISLPFWCLYLLGLRLPHGGIIYHSNGFHELYNYGFFLTSAKVSNSIFPRFSSIFLEPGQFATPCAFLYFLNGASFNRKNLVLMVGIVFSFSLIGYALMVISIVSARMVQNVKHRVSKTISVLFLVVASAFYLTGNEENDNPFYTLIVSRLEYDSEKIITGNNRYSVEFEDRYKQFIKTEKRFFGVHQELRKGYNWSTHASGYKKAIAHFGLVGFFLVILFVLTLFFCNRCFVAFWFLAIVVVAYIVRDLLFSPLWISIMITGFFMLKSSTLAEMSKLEIKKEKI